MHKIKPGALTTGTVFKDSFKEKNESLLPVIRYLIDEFSQRNTIMLETIFIQCTMVKQLEIPTYLLTLSYTDLR